MQHVGGCEYVCLYTVCELLGLYSTIATVAIEMAVTVCCYQFLLSFLGATKTFSLLGMSCLQPPTLTLGTLLAMRWGGGSHCRDEELKELFQLQVVSHTQSLCDVSSKL